MSEPRSPHDGKPYYCTTCGLAWGEYMGCSDVDCSLETETAAQRRAEFNREMGAVLADALASSPK